MCTSLAYLRVNHCGTQITSACTFARVAWTLTYEYARYTLNDMTEKRWNLHGDQRDDEGRLVIADGPAVDDLEQVLAEQIGGRWDGWHIGDWHDGGDTPDAALFARVSDIGGHKRLTGLLLLAEDGVVSARDLRKVRVAAIENSLTLSSHHGDGQLEELKSRPKLARQDEDRPEEFSKRVADYFTAWSQLTPNPVAAMVAEYGVNSSTMHAWVREARLRGLLPPARRRKGAAS